MSIVPRITPNLWFDTQAKEAAKFYTSVFKNSQIERITRYPQEGQEVHGKTAGTVMTVEFRLDGQRFVALNGGPQFKFNEAISLIVSCETQEEIDYYWEKLGEGGDDQAQVCGWLKDKFGVSWQIVPTVMTDWFQDDGSAGAKRAMNAMLQMKKMDIEALKKAYGVS